MYSSLPADKYLLLFDTGDSIRHPVPDPSSAIWPARAIYCDIERDYPNERIGRRVYHCDSRLNEARDEHRNVVFYVVDRFGEFAAWYDPRTMVIAQPPPSGVRSK